MLQLVPMWAATLLQEGAASKGGEGGGKGSLRRVPDKLNERKAEKGPLEVQMEADFQLQFEYKLKLKLKLELKLKLAEIVA